MNFKDLKEKIIGKTIVDIDASWRDIDFNCEIKLSDGSLISVCFEYGEGEMDFKKDGEIYSIQRNAGRS